MFPRFAPEMDLSRRAQERALFGGSSIPSIRISYSMPRTSLAKHLNASKASGPIIPGASLPPPRLWNAHKRIKTGQVKPLAGRLHGLRPGMQEATTKGMEVEQNQKQVPEEDDRWREVVTPDIVEFIDKAKVSPEDLYRILRNPHQFFSRPRNVPVEFRKQVYLYAISVQTHSWTSC